MFSQGKITSFFTPSLGVKKFSKFVGLKTPPFFFFGGGGGDTGLPNKKECKGEIFVFFIKEVQLSNLMMHGTI